MPQEKEEKKKHRMLGSSPRWVHLSCNKKFMRLESLPALISMFLRKQASNYLFRDLAFNNKEASRIWEILPNFHDHKWLERRFRQVKDLVVTDWFPLIRLEENNVFFKFLIRRFGLGKLSVFCLLSDSRWKALGMSGLLRRLPERERKDRNCCVLSPWLSTKQVSTFTLKSRWFQDPP